jgi:hypothetical protein
MSENEQNGERVAVDREAPPENRSELRGERPPGVIGEMHPERFLKRSRRWRKEGFLEEEERIWRPFEPSLRDSKASFPEEEEDE